MSTSPSIPRNALIHRGSHEGAQASTSWPAQPRVFFLPSPCRGVSRMRISTDRCFRSFGFPPAPASGWLPAPWTKRAKASSPERPPFGPRAVPREPPPGSTSYKISLDGKKVSGLAGGHLDAPLPRGLLDRRRASASDVVFVSGSTSIVHFPFSILVLLSIPRHACAGQNNDEREMLVFCLGTSVIEAQYDDDASFQPTAVSVQEVV